MANDPKDKPKDVPATKNATQRIAEQKDAQARSVTDPAAIKDTPVAEKPEALQPHAVRGAQPGSEGNRVTTMISDKDGQPMAPRPSGPSKDAAESAIVGTWSFDPSTNTVNSLPNPDHNFAGGPGRGFMIEENVFNEKIRPLLTGKTSSAGSA